MRNERSGAFGAMGDRRNAYRVLMGRIEGRRLLGRPRLGGRIISEWIFKKWDEGEWTGLVWLRLGTSVGLL